MIGLKNILLAGMRKRWIGFGLVTSKFYPQGIISTNKFGVSMKLNPMEAIEGSVLFDGYFDEPVLLALQKNMNADGILWDVGANVGLHSFTIKKLIPSMNCYAFEPYYKNFERLCINQRLNPDLSIHKLNLALDKQPGLVKLYSTPNNAGRTSIHSLHNSFATDVYAYATTGDSLINAGIPEPNVIKLDTEGNELAILQGCTHILENSKLHTIIYESFDLQQDLENHLKRFGFAVNPIDRLGNFVATR